MYNFKTQKRELKFEVSGRINFGDKIIITFFIVNKCSLAIYYGSRLGIFWEY